MFSSFCSSQVSIARHGGAHWDASKSLEARKATTRTCRAAVLGGVPIVKHGNARTPFNDSFMPPTGSPSARRHAWRWIPGENKMN